MNLDHLKAKMMQDKREMTKIVALSTTENTKLWYLKNRQTWKVWIRREILLPRNNLNFCKRTSKMKIISSNTIAMTQSITTKKKIFQHNTKQNLLQQRGHDCKKCIWKYHFKVYKLKKISCEIFFMCKSIIC